MPDVVIDIERLDDGSRQELTKLGFVLVGTRCATSPSARIAVAGRGTAGA